MSNEYESRIAELEKQMALVSRTQRALVTAVQQISTTMSASSHDLGQTDMVVNDTPEEIRAGLSMLNELLDIEHDV